MSGNQEFLIGILNNIMGRPFMGLIIAIVILKSLGQPISKFIERLKSVKKGDFEANAEENNQVNKNEEAENSMLNEFEIQNNILKQKVTDLLEKEDENSKVINAIFEAMEYYQLNYYNLFLVDTSKEVLKIIYERNGLEEIEIIDFCKTWYNETGDYAKQAIAIRDALTGIGCIEKDTSTNKFIITPTGEKFLRHFEIIK